MKLVQTTGIAGAALAAFAIVACGANSKYSRAQQAEERAEEERQEAREARADAQRAREEAAKAEAEAQRATEAQREADRQAQIANERAAQAEKQESREAYGGAVRRAGVTEQQPQRAVLFMSGSADLSSDARARLDEIARVIRARGQSHDVVIEGYSDDTGPESENVDLSQRRADAVAAYLVNRGVLRERITVRGLGSRNPASREDTDRGRALNRRVEIMI
jgi:outer membrane protein OmpA-like peptidoglycan-associated protein